MKTKTKAGPPLTSQRFGHGIGVSAGIAIGAAHVVEPALGAVPEYRIASGQIDKELVRFRASAQAARAQIGKLRRKAATCRVRPATTCCYCWTRTAA